MAVIIIGLATNDGLGIIIWRANPTIAENIIILPKRLYEC